MPKETPTKEKIEEYATIPEWKPELTIETPASFLERIWFIISFIFKGKAKLRLWEKKKQNKK